MDENTISLLVILWLYVMIYVGEVQKKERKERMNELRKVGIDANLIHADQEWLESVGRLPENIEDVKEGD